MRGLFLSATGTGVGKTLVGAALALYQRRRGADTGVMKPAETGIDDPSLPGDDAVLLTWAAASQDPTELLAPWRLREPLAPAIAAHRQNLPLDFDHLLHCARTLAGRHRAGLLVEGAGGLLVPLCSNHLVIDLPRLLPLPVLLIIGSGLGTINHTLLSLGALREAGVDIAGYLINRMPCRPGLAEATLVDGIAPWTDVPCLGVLPEVDGNQRDKVIQLADLIANAPELSRLLQALSAHCGN
jgi:dethiobiotin synthetase